MFTFRATAKQINSRVGQLRSAPPLRRVGRVGCADQPHNHTTSKNARMKSLEKKTFPEPLPNSGQRRLPRFISLLAGLGVLALINGYFRKTEPTVYALCSPHGTAHIYTVDANDAKAQCLAVKGERFLHTGAYGKNIESPRLLEKLTRVPRQPSYRTNTLESASNSYGPTRSLSRE